MHNESIIIYKFYILYFYQYLIIICYYQAKKISLSILQIDFIRKSLQNYNCFVISLLELIKLFHRLRFRIYQPIINPISFRRVMEKYLLLISFISRLI